MLSPLSTSRMNRPSLFHPVSYLGHPEHREGSAFSWSIKPSTIRTSAKPASNSFRIRTSKIQHLKPFRMNTSEKTPEGVPPSSQNVSVFAVRFVVNPPNFEFPFSNFDPHGTNLPLARLHWCEVMSMRKFMMG